MNIQTGVYAAIAAAGVLLAAGLFLSAVRRDGLPAGRAAAGYLLGLLCAFLLAKAVYAALFSSSLGGDGPLKWLRLKPGEFSFVAGALGFCLGNAWLFRGERLPVLLDDLAVPGCLLAAFLRFGENFLGQLALADPATLGLPAIGEGSLAAIFPLSVPDAWGYRYLSAATVSAALCLAAAGLGLAAGRKNRGGAFRLPRCMVFTSCAFLLCASRFFLELTRMESLLFYFVHVDQVLCAVFMALLLLHACFALRKRTGRFPAVYPAVFFLCLAVNGLTQYLMDKPWQFESLLPEGVFLWICDSLPGFGFLLLLATSALPVLLYGLLCRRLRNAAPGVPS